MPNPEAKRRTGTNDLARCACGCYLDAHGRKAQRPNLPHACSLCPCESWSMPSGTPGLEPGTPDNIEEQIEEMFGSK